MNWITDFVRPKLRALVGKDIPENLWDKCSKCEQMIFHRDLAENNFVCRHCGHHMRLEAKKRLELLFDDQEYTRIPIPQVKHDPLKFKDLKKYSDRLKEARQKTEEEDAILIAVGRIGGHKSVIIAFEFNFMGGSMGAAVGAGFVAAAQAAIKYKAPLIVVPSSGGARMQEGILSLMQMPRTTIAVRQVKEAGLPYITILTDPTTGAMIGFAGARVIQQTIRHALPEGFQTAEYLLEHGMIDMVVPRREMKERLITLLNLLMKSRI